MNLHNSLNYLSKQRPCIRPNPGFIWNLVKFEKETFGVNESSLDLHEYYLRHWSAFKYFPKEVRESKICNGWLFEKSCEEEFENALEELM